MSSWTYINGTITVSPLGRTQAEKKYILDTILNHLPQVTGSERDMNVYMVQKKGHNNSSSCDEYGDRSNNLIDILGNKSQDSGWLRIQDDYILIVDGSFRDREFSETFKEFINFISRLSKRVLIDDVLVKIEGYNKETLVTNKNHVFGDMFEYPNWHDEKDRAENWCEHLMWEYEK